MTEGEFFLPRKKERVALKRRYQIEQQRAVQQFRRLAAEHNPKIQMMLPLALAAKCVLRITKVLSLRRYLLQFPGIFLYTDVMTVARRSPFGVLFIYQDRTTQADIKDIYTGVVIIVARTLKSSRAALGDRSCGSALTDNGFEKSSLAKNLGIGDVQGYLRTNPSTYTLVASPSSLPRASLDYRHGKPHAAGELQPRS
jgi:hypothetical protein